MCARRTNENGTRKLEKRASLWKFNN
jgi:hypothetical protein